MQFPFRSLILPALCLAQLQAQLPAADSLPKILRPTQIAPPLATEARPIATIEISLAQNAARTLPVPAHFPWAEKDAGTPLQLLEVTPGSFASNRPVPAQYEADPAHPGQGRLWWMLAPSKQTDRRFRVLKGKSTPTPALVIAAGDRPDTYDIRDGRQPVLRYNHGTVPVPEGVGTNYARGDYIMPLFGPAGEMLTDDYPKDHPHHRGLGWSWPVTRWKDEVRDIWAVVGVWARPVAIARKEAGPVFALLEAENVWKWSDTTNIVKEEVRLQVFHAMAGQRWIEITVRLTGLVDGVAIGGRPHGGYGGFGLRAQPAKERVITRFTDPAGTEPRRAWLDYSGLFGAAAAPAGLAIFEHPENPLYPSELKEYPELNYVMPAFPGEREVPLPPGQPLVLRHLVWIHPGMATPDQLGEIWTAYAEPPQAHSR